MPYQILDHTADIRMKVSGETLLELFKSAAQGLAEILSPQSRQKRPQSPVSTQTVSIQAADATNLLIDFLSEILSLSNIHKEVYFSVEFDQFSPNSLTAQLTGIRVKSFAEDIKAVTYHEAEVKKNKQDFWETGVVFDI